MLKVVSISLQQAYFKNEIKNVIYINIRQHQILRNKTSERCARPYTLNHNIVLREIKEDLKKFKKWGSGVERDRSTFTDGKIQYYEEVDDFFQNDL